MMEVRLATVEQCERALRELAATLAKAGQPGGGSMPDRSVSCRVRDLDVIFAGRLADGELGAIQRTDDPKADIRLSAASDDLVSLVDGSLGFASAWASGRLKVEGSIFDLLKLRKLL